MLIRLASDLHLEGLYNKKVQTLVKDFLPADPRDAEAILVLAGDVSSRPDQLIDFLRAVSEKFHHVLFVPGNHEFYRHDYHKWNIDMRAAVDELNTEIGNKISFCADDVIEVIFGELRFLLTTLWGDGGKTSTDHFMVDHGLNDFRVIRYGDSRFTVQDMMSIHEAQKSKLVKLLKTPFNGKTVVVTHHLPSYRLCHPRFGTDINGGFASNCDDILAYDHAPTIWIHGHTHDTQDGVMWKTRIVCNPAGYRGEWGSSYNTYQECGPKFIDLKML